MGTLAREGPGWSLAEAAGEFALGAVEGVAGGIIFAGLMAAGPVGWLVAAGLAVWGLYSSYQTVRSIWTGYGSDGQTLDLQDRVNMGARMFGQVVGAAGVASLSGPKGPLFGRAKYRNGVAGVFNRGETLRLGWSWNEGRNWFNFHGGKRGTPGHWHSEWPIPGPGDEGWW